MCGISGFLGPVDSRDESLAVLRRMADSIMHRGPDDDGYWLDEKAGIGFGHRRLAIVDLSPAGHQPMWSESGRYVISYNGEIYNFRELRAQLENAGRSFRGHSDTEVMLAAIDEWGVAPAVERFNGMFVFSLWDVAQQVLYLGRDRVGKKPLYYGWFGNTFLFASELKALRLHPAFRGDVDRNVLALYMRHNYVPGPYSIYEGVKKLPPGCLLEVSRSTRDSVPRPFWSPLEVSRSALASPWRGGEDEALDQLDALLRDAVALRMVADVPLGAFLSGGIDSSMIVALMQAQASTPVKSFTVGFHESEYNEAESAKAVAHHLGTDHTELYVTPEETMAVIPRLPTIYDEPFADSSQIPTFLICELARGHVTVTLSGDGGDELFGGYTRYALAKKIWGTTSWMPRSMRRFAGSALEKLSPEGWDALLRPAQRLVPKRGRSASPGHRVHRLAEMLRLPDFDALYYGLLSHWREPETLVFGANEPPTPVTGSIGVPRTDDAMQRMMYLDAISYLPDDILVKVDRASMAVSLEARAPLLDHRLLSFAWSLPTPMKIKNGEGKLLLRKLLHRYIPVDLVERPKMGFGVPIDRWLRGPLRAWAESLLDENRLRSEGFFDPEPIRSKWSEHLTGARNWHYHLWDVLMFEAWLDEQRRDAS
jgi:asparagine synthase (glutamine-hydrolysing)